MFVFSEIKIIAISLFFVAFIVEDVNACHNALHGGFYGRKRSVIETTEDSNYEIDATYLIEYFTNCMNVTSNISFDWYSATEWTVNESNWFYYTDNNDCAGEGSDNETNCWLLNVDIFFGEDIQPQVKNCIALYADEFNFTYDESLLLSNHGRKKRRTGTPPVNPKPPNNNKNMRNQDCPSISSEYNTELTRLVPPDMSSSQNGHVLNVTNIVTFVDLYTICDECERYSGEPAVDCFANRLNQLTRFDSRIKQAVQVTNARYANGGDTVGNCRDNVYQTEWFDVDSPNAGNGDRETLAAIRQQFPMEVCKNPEGIQAQLSTNMKPYGRGNDTLSISPEEGLICLNADQKSGRCQNYRVRFCCKDFVGKCPLRNGWTSFFDHSKPRELGEFEHRCPIYQANSGRMCPNPTAVGARLLNNVTYQLSGDLLTIDPSLGLSCVNEFQDDGQCEDYKVRFCCPAMIGRCLRGHKWTKWYTQRPNDIGDNETLNRLQELQDWQCTSTPSALEAQLAKSRRPYIEGGNKLQFINPRKGLLCLNSRQLPGSTCRDFRVRFCCLLRR